MAKKKTEKTNTIPVDMKDMYQLLISECRYGYSRNNHLMPYGAYDKVKTYLPIMAQKDIVWALHTAAQLCDECISDQLIWNFGQGYDDEHGNREAAFEFVAYLMDWINTQARECVDSDEDEITKAEARSYVSFVPYNFDHYTRNRELDDVPRYSVYEIEYTSGDIDTLTYDPHKAVLNDHLLSRNEYKDFIYTKILGLKDGDSITCNHWAQYPKYDLEEFIGWKRYAAQFEIFRFNSIKKIYVVVNTKFWEEEK